MNVKKKTKYEGEAKHNGLLTWRNPSKRRSNHKWSGRRYSPYARPLKNRPPEESVIVHDGGVLLMSAVITIISQSSSVGVDDGALLLVHGKYDHEESHSLVSS